MDIAPCLCFFLPTTAKKDSCVLLDIDHISTVTSLVLPLVWLHHRLGAFNTPALKLQECYCTEKRLTELAKSGYIQEENNNSFYESRFQLNQCLYDAFTDPHKKRNLPRVWTTYFWTTLPLEDVEGHSTQCNAVYYMWQVAFATANYLRGKWLWKHAPWKPRI